MQESRALFQKEFRFGRQRLQAQQRAPAENRGAEEHLCSCFFLTNNPFWAYNKVYEFLTNDVTSEVKHHGRRKYKRQTFGRSKRTGAPALGVGGFPLNSQTMPHFQFPAKLMIGGA
jgi:hypothetical protein